VYVNARYFIWKDEWDFWFSESVSGRVPDDFVTLARKNLEPIQDRMNLVEDESDVLPGIHMIAAPGHTPGHAVVSFSSGGEELLYLGDTVLYPLHLDHLDWLPIYDILPEKADPSKHKIFDYAADKNTWVIGQHFPPFPSLGHIAKKDDGWQWQPVEMVENL
jgi:glyoxylase-like metal-dependent hydrolase (beta-lactamase superfamily II)